MLNHLKPFLLTQYEEYREAFVGGGSIFFSIDPCNRRWINDKNDHLMSVYRALQERPEELIAKCRAIAPASVDEEVIISSRGTRYNRRLRELFHAIMTDPKVDPALQYLFLNRTGFNGRVILEPGRLDRNFFSNPAGWNTGAIDRLGDAAELLRETQITCGDYEPLLVTPGKDVLVYCDPPYVRDTELPDASKLYEYGFTLHDHYRLRDAVRRSPHQICLSYDDHPLIRELYGDMNIHECSWFYSGTVTRRREGRELVITNYPVASALSHDAA